MAAAESSAGGRGESGDAASSDQAELAKQLQNPIADLLSVPLQNNWDFGIGPADAMKYTVNIQPVIPVSLTGACASRQPSCFQKRGGDSGPSHAQDSWRSS
jgi:hypothetical protein